MKIGTNGNQKGIVALVGQILDRRREFVEDGYDGPLAVHIPADLLPVFIKPYPYPATGRSGIQRVLDISGVESVVFVKSSTRIEVKTINSRRTPVLPFRQ